MRPDNIGYTVKNDVLICFFRESCINKLARLKSALKASSTIEGLIDILEPECYKIIVAKCLDIPGQNFEHLI